MNYSVGTNVVSESCLKDLNVLLKLIVPIAKDMPWSHWYEIIHSGNKIITCFDDVAQEVIGMITLVPIIKPCGRFALLCDKSISKHSLTSQITEALYQEALRASNKLNLTLVLTTEKI